MAASKKIEVKLVVVGDGAVGKTFPEEYVPTVFENYENELTLDGQTVKYSLWDTAGQEGFTRIRTLSYPNTDVFLLCYAVDNQDSLLNIKERWVKEVGQHCPNTPKILVGTKIDLRGPGSIPTEEGKRMADDIGASAYLECSAKTREGLNDVFEAALHIVLQKRSKELGADSVASVSAAKTSDKQSKESCILS